VKFIELTQLDGSKIVINCFKIKSFYEYRVNNDAHTVINLDDGFKLHIKNIYEDIKGMLDTEEGICL
jgi:hypothetical protein